MPGFFNVLIYGAAFIYVLLAWVVLFGMIGSAVIFILKMRKGGMGGTIPDITKQWIDQQ